MRLDRAQPRGRIKACMPRACTVSTLLTPLTSILSAQLRCFEFCCLSKKNPSGTHTDTAQMVMVLFAFLLRSLRCFKKVPAGLLSPPFFSFSSIPSFFPFLRPLFFLHIPFTPPHSHTHFFFQHIQLPSTFNRNSWLLHSRFSLQEQDSEVSPSPCYWSVPRLTLSSLNPPPPSLLSVKHTSYIPLLPLCVD